MGMKITGIQGMTPQQVRDEVQRGGRFVIYQYCISILVMSYKRSSDVIFVKSDQSRHAKGLPYVLISLVAGWWGIPWGPIWTIGTTARNLSGGLDVTQEVVAQVAPKDAAMQEMPVRSAA